MSRDFPSSKLKDLKPAKMWAAISYDTPPEIWETAFYREHLQSNLRHIRVTVAPIERKKPAKKRAR